MTVVWSLIAFLLVIVWIISITDIVRRRGELGRGRLAAWLLIVLIFPFAGALLYWVLRSPTPEETQRQIDAERELRHGGPRPPFDPTRLGS